MGNLPKGDKATGGAAEKTGEHTSEFMEINMGILQLKIVETLAFDF